MSESAEEMHKRLCRVTAAARFEVLDSPYAWEQISASSGLPANALAVVRDGSSWYALTSVPPSAKEGYRILVFHFAEGSNASGFVAWLAGIIKKEVGTGAMVVCGFDARATPALWQTSLGLFDYWGCPWDRGDEVAALVQRLRLEGSR
jgi:hypothetical protein